MTSVFATIANQGIRVEPSIVKAIVEADGTVVDTPDAERSRAVREDTARQVMAMMEAVTGTAALPRKHGFPATVSQENRNCAVCRSRLPLLRR